MHWVVDLGKGCCSMRSDIGDFRLTKKDFVLKSFWTLGGTQKHRRLFLVPWKHVVKIQNHSRIHEKKHTNLRQDSEILFSFFRCSPGIICEIAPQLLSAIVLIYDAPWNLSWCIQTTSESFQKWPEEQLFWHKYPQGAKGTFEDSFLFPRWDNVTSIQGYLITRPSALPPPKVVATWKIVMLQIPGPRRGFTTGFQLEFFELLIVSKAANPPKKSHQLQLGLLCISFHDGFPCFLCFPHVYSCKQIDMTPASHHLDKRTSGCRYLADSRVLSWLLEVYTQIFFWIHDYMRISIRILSRYCTYIVDIFLRFLTSIMLIYNDIYHNIHWYIHTKTPWCWYFFTNHRGQAVAETGKRIRDLRGPKGGENFHGDLHESYNKGSTGNHGVNESILRLFKGSWERTGPTSEDNI